MGFDTGSSFDSGVDSRAGIGATQIRQVASLTPPLSPTDRAWIGIASVLPGVSLPLAVALWLASLAGLSLEHITDYGLVSVLPLTYFAALAIVTAGFALTVHRQESPNWLLFLHVAVLVVIIHGTPSIGYGTLRYAWAWKHIGMVDYIQRLGTVDPQIAQLAELSANHNWPGFFALAALFTQAGGFASALSFASLAPLFFNLINIGALLLVFGALVRDRRLKWCAIWFFFLANWIAQDYFAPQALTYFLFLVSIGVLLTWFGTRPLPRQHSSGLHNPLDHLESLWARFDNAGENIATVYAQPSSRQRMALMAMTILFLAVIVTSHQLTPFMAIFALGALVACYRLSARSLPLLLAVMTTTWMLYVAWSFVGGNLQWIIRTIGELDRNTSIANLSSLSDPQQVVALSARGLTALVVLLAAAGLVQRLRHRRRDSAAALLMLAPLPMLLVSSYGGEILLRVYFFALPFLAFFAAAVIYPSSNAGSSWRTPVLVVALSAVLLSGLMLAYFGRERMNYFTPNEVDAARYLYENAPAGALILAASDNYPSLFANYEHYTHRSLSGPTITKTRLSRLVNEPQSLVASLMTEYDYPASYLIVTRSQKAHIEMNLLLPPGTIDHLQDELENSEGFRVVYQNSDAEIFVLAAQLGGSR